jgi:hypothetical protein
VLTIQLCVAPAGGRLTPSVTTVSTTTANDFAASTRQAAKTASEPSRKLRPESELIFGTAIVIVSLPRTWLINNSGCNSGLGQEHTPQS